MKQIFKAKISVIIFIILILFLAGKWVINEKSLSFSEPQDALLNVDKKLFIIPADKNKEEALLFFIKDKNKLGAAYVQNQIFGWKIGLGEIPYTPIGDLKEYEKISKYQVHDDFLVYGLIRNAGDYTIKVNGNEAKKINLGKLNQNDVREYDLENMYLWYYESKDVLAEGDIELFDKGDKKIDTTELILPKKKEQ